MNQISKIATMIVAIAGATECMAECHSDSEEKVKSTEKQNHEAPKVSEKSSKDE